MLVVGVEPMVSTYLKGLVDDFHTITYETIGIILTSIQHIVMMANT